MDFRWILSLSLMQGPRDNPGIKILAPSPQPKQRSKIKYADKILKTIDKSKGNKV